MIAQAQIFKIPKIITGKKDLVVLPLKDFVNLVKEKTKKIKVSEMALLAEYGGAFDFLNKEKDIYTTSDILIKKSN